jgi:inosine/xanthosine triphosphate pyrophosphatase family protein
MGQGRSAQGLAAGRARTAAARLGLSVIVAASMAASGLPPAQGQTQTMTANPAKVAELKMALRGLYEDHVFWVRDLVISTRLGIKGAASEADEYGLKNAKAIGAAIAPIYGQAAADKFSALFVGHYEAVKGYMKAAFANGYHGNAAQKKAAVDALSRNGKAIAAFVASANPNLPEGSVYGLLVSHVQHHIMEIDAVAKEDWSAEADEWEPMVKQIYSLTDALADGIAKQFPTKFQ